MNESAVMRKEKLDDEWVELILEALETGISPEKIRHFFKEPSSHIENTSVFAASE